MNGSAGKIKTLAAAAAVFFAMLAGVTVQAYAADDSTAGDNAKDVPVVRTAYGYNDFLNVDEEGVVSGYYAEYLKKLAEIGGWKYEYVKASWTEAVDMLEKGEIDLLFPTNITEEREKTMDFSKMPTGYTASGIFALSGSNYDYDDFSSFDKKRIAFGKNSSNETELEEYSKKHGFTYTPVYRDTAEDVINALKNDEADFAVFSAANYFPDGMLLSLMDAKPVYFAVKEGDTKMLDMLNKSMDKLISTSPDLVSEVLKKTLVGSNSIMVGLTSDEWDYIRTSPTVKIGFYEETEPLAYIKEDGSYGGIYIELLNYIDKNSGLNIELVPISRDKTWKELIYSGEIDMYIGASGVIISENSDYMSTDSLLDYSNLLVTRNDCVFNRLKKPVVALTSGRSYWVDYITEYLGADVEIKYYRTAKDCMSAVSTGEADASLINNLEYNYHSKNDRMSNIMQWPQYRFPTDVVLTAAANVDPIMFSTVNKTLGMLSSAYVNEIVDEYLNMPYHSYTLIDQLYNARFVLAVIAVLILVSAIIAVAVVMYRRRVYAMRRREQQQLQVLAALSRNYVAVYYTDLDRDTCEVMQLAESSKSRISGHSKHSKALFEYIDTYVLPEYRETLMPFCDPEKVKRIFEGAKFFTVRYRAPAEDYDMDYFEMHFVDMSDDKEHRMVFGVRCIDEMIKEEQAQQKLLRDALDGANRANATKSEFLSRMSHDIRTPMNAIIGMTAIAEAHLHEPERVKDSLGKINGASRHLLNLINEVLDMSKIESGKMSLTEEDIVLSELVENMIDIVRPQVDQHKHKLSVDMSGIVHDNVIGDVLHIQQAFVNIMSNAVKYTPDGGQINVKVSEKSMTAQNVACYEFVVQDNGIGMTEDVVSRIFDPFERVEDLRISKIQGTGLGLPITLNIVQMMNGNIHVDSEPSVGSTFTMTIFLTVRDEPHEKYKEAASDTASEIKDLENINFDGKRVLLVEDNMLNREIAKEILEMTGLEVEEAEDGKQSVDMFINSELNHYDAILMDIQMPVMNGYEATKAIRAIGRSDALKIPIIALTANAFVEDVQEAKNAGMDAHLAKPIDLTKLKEILVKFLK